MENMKAVRVRSHGGPEVLRFEDAPRALRRALVNC
jgi:hypothetical protein